MRVPQLSRVVEMMVDKGEVQPFDGIRRRISVKLCLYRNHKIFFALLHIPSMCSVQCRIGCS